MQIASILILIAFSGGIEAEHVDVLILGAGLSGLTAAKTLSENNLTNFLILEGSNRIGGRIKHGNIDSSVVELGCTYIVGTDGNPVWDLAEKYGLHGQVTNYDSLVVVDEGGNDVTNTEGAAANTLFNKAQETVNKIYLDIKAGTTEDMAASAALKRGLWYPDTPVKRTVEWYDYDFTFFQPSNLVSVDSYGTFYNQLETDGSSDNFLVNDQRGFVYMLNQMKNEFLTSNDARLKLNQVVKTVAYSDSKVTVTTLDNQIYSADYAIITFGLGVLQNNLITFEPPLPEWKEDPLFRINVGHSATVIVKCQPECRAFMKDNEYAEYASENYGFHPLWINLNKGPFQSNRDVISSVPISDEAERVERIAASALNSEITQLLRDVNQDPGLAEPSHILVSDWSKNPLFLGSSASLPVGFTDDQMKAVKAPLGRLHFAGDAYHKAYTGFLQGAYYTGRDEANEILRKSGSIPMQIPSVLVIIICVITSYVDV